MTLWQAFQQLSWSGALTLVAVLYVTFTVGYTLGQESNR